MTAGGRDGRPVALLPRDPGGAARVVRRMGDVGAGGAAAVLVV
jgi:hypothetical protein